MEGWDKALWLFKSLRKKSGEDMSILTNKLDAIQNIFKTAGSATAEGKDILYGKTAYNGSTLLTGSMPNRGKQSASLNCGGSFTIPEGYHDGTGVVTANSLASQTAVDADKAAVTASAMLEGRQGYVNGNKISGTMSNKAGVTVVTNGVSISGDNTYLSIPATGYYNTDSLVRASNSLFSSGIKITPLYGGKATYSRTGNGTKTATVTYTLTEDYDYIIAAGSGCNAYSDSRGFQGTFVTAPTYSGTGTIVSDTNGILVVKGAKKGGVLTKTNRYTMTLNGEVDLFSAMSVAGVNFGS